MNLITKAVVIASSVLFAAMLLIVKIQTILQDKYSAPVLEIKLEGVFAACQNLQKIVYFE